MFQVFENHAMTAECDSLDEAARLAKHVWYRGGRRVEVRGNGIVIYRMN